MPQRPLDLHLPLLPDQDYVALLQLFGARVHSVYASLHILAISDARPCGAPLPENMLFAMVQASPAPVYLLLNSRFHSPEAYVASGCARLAALLDSVLAAGTVAGVVYADAILLTALARHAPSLARALEAVPSVNCGLDSWDKARQHLEMAESLGFRLPGILVPDRALNRNPARLAEFRRAMRVELPGAALHLLANEGCLWQCPYKPAHDALMACARCAGHTGDGVFKTLQDAACLRRYWDEPWRVLASPFIRPEDLPLLAGVADGVKLGGRSRGARAMQMVIRAYVAGRYEGNLLELLDTAEALAGCLHLSNHRLPGDFHAAVSACDKDCARCGWCRKIADNTIRRNNISLE